MGSFFTGLVGGIGEAQHEQNLISLEREKASRQSFLESAGKQLETLPYELRDEAQQKLLGYTADPKMKATKMATDWHGWIADKSIAWKQQPQGQPQAQPQGGLAAPPPQASAGAAPGPAVNPVAGPVTPTVRPVAQGQPQAQGAGTPPPGETLYEVRLRQEAGRAAALKKAEAGATASGQEEARIGATKALAKELQDADPSLSKIMALNMATAAVAGRPFTPGMLRPQKGVQMTGDQANAAGLTGVDGTPIPKGPELYQEFRTPMGDTWAEASTPSAMVGVHIVPGFDEQGKSVLQIMDKQGNVLKTEAAPTPSGALAITQTGQGPVVVNKGVVAAGNQGKAGVSKPLGPPPSVNPIAQSRLQMEQTGIADLRKDAIKASQEALKAKNILDTAESQARNPSPRGDLAIIVEAVRSMNPGSVRLNSQQVEMELKAGSYGARFQRYYEIASKGLLPADQRADLMNQIRNSAGAIIQNAGELWDNNNPGMPRPPHLRQGTKSPPPGSAGMVRMTGPKGTFDVPGDKVQIFKDNGYSQVQ